MQIRTKITLQFISIVAGILLLTLIVIYYKFKQLTEDEFYDNLRSKALMTAQMVLHDDKNLPPLEESTASATPLPFSENITIYNAQYQRVFAFNYATFPLQPNLLQSIYKQGEKRFEKDGLNAIGVKFDSKTNRQYTVIAEAKYMPEDLELLRNILIVSFLISISIIAIGGWIFAGQALEPVSAIVNQVERILPSKLDQRLATGNTHDELARLVATFNRLLDRIQLAFGMQKNFISNISHELKNPLTVILAQLEVALQKERSPSEYKHTLQSVIEDVKELNDASEKLLQLARLHSDANLPTLQKIRLDELILHVKESIQQLHPSVKIKLEITALPEEEEQLLIQANEPLLKIALMNLVDNACKFSDGNPVKINCRFGGRGVAHHIQVVDQGLGMSVEDVAQLFQPFYRSTLHSHIRGSGVGLSLVKSILELHKIKLTVASRLAQGSTFSLEIPALR